MAEQPDIASTPNPSAQRRAFPRRWAALTAALAALGLSIAALVVSLNRGPSSESVGSGADLSCPTITVARSQLPSVVTIRATGDQAGTGSGSIIDKSGHILTNNHVIATAASGGSITVLFNDGSSEPATLVGRDPQTDLAVLQIANESDHTPITFGSSDDLRVGQPVIALGAPLGLSGTVTTGIVSALDRSVNVPADNGGTAVLVAAVQTDAAINPGNSGGALVDCSGDLIGIPTAGATEPDESGEGGAGSIGIGFAIPSDFARSIADELIKTGRVTHGYLGLSVGTAPNGLYISAVTAGGPAAQAGLQPGDIISSIDGAPAVNAGQLLAVTVAKNPGDKVTLEYVRNAAREQAQVIMGSR